MGAILRSVGRETAGTNFHNAYYPGQTCLCGSSHFSPTQNEDPLTVMQLSYRFSFSSHIGTPVGFQFLLKEAMGLGSVASHANETYYSDLLTQLKSASGTHNLPRTKWSSKTDRSTTTLVKTFIHNKIPLHSSRIFNLVAKLLGNNYRTQGGKSRTISSSLSSTKR